MSYFSDLILAKNPEVFWECNEPSGTTLVDSTGHGHDGTYSGGFTLAQPGLVVRDGGRSVLLNGSTGVANAGVNGVDISSGDWTMEAWVVPQAFDAVVHRGIIGTNGQNTFALIAKVGTKRLDVTIANIADASVTANTDMPLNAVSCVGATFIDSLDLVSYYFNGLPDGTATLTGTATAGTKTSCIGSRTSTDHFWQGYIAKAAIYTYALTPESMLQNALVGFDRLRRLDLSSFPRPNLAMAA